MVPLHALPVAKVDTNHMADDLPSAPDASDRENGADRGIERLPARQQFSGVIYKDKQGKKEETPYGDSSQYEWLINYLLLKAAIFSMSMRTLFEYPHSLSYHETTFTKVSVSAIPAALSKIDVRASPRKSDETTASSV